MNQIQVDIIEAERFQGSVNAFLNTFVPWIIELGGDPDLFSGNARVFDALADFVLVPICKSSVVCQTIALKKDVITNVSICL